jgi:hypothetical protein
MANARVRPARRFVDRRLSSWPRLRHSCSHTGIPSATAFEGGAISSSERHCSIAAASRRVFLGGDFRRIPYLAHVLLGGEEAGEDHVGADGDGRYNQHVLCGPGQGGEEGQRPRMQSLWHGAARGNVLCGKGAKHQSDDGSTAHGAGLGLPLSIGCGGSVGLEDHGTGLDYE